MPLAVSRLDGRVAVGVDVRVAGGGAEDRPASLENAAHRVPVERPDGALQQPVPAVQDPDHVDPAPFPAGDHGADER